MPSISHRDSHAYLPSPGLYSYLRQKEDERAHLHLRVRSNGEGLLLINANRVLHLNPTATSMAYLMLEEKDEREALKKLRSIYRVDAKTLRRDLLEIQSQIDQLIRVDGACPIHDLELEVLPPFSQMPQAPYRMDLALTYRCNCNCSHCYNARARDFPEIETDRWRQILNSLWEIGIPHICFTGGEATLRDDLPELIRHAKELGQITGLLTNGRQLADPICVEKLSRAGLDHVQITLESHDPEIHDRMVRARGAWNQTVEGIRNALASGFYVMTNSTLLRENAPAFEKTIDFLAELGVPTIGCNALIYAGPGETVGTGIPEHDLEPLLKVVRAQTERYGQRLIWYTPTQYCHFDPMQLELGVKACTAAMYNMCIEPNGDVIPCQSFYQALGNLLHDPWESIWNHDISLWLRERRYAPQECLSCPALKECGGGCPLTLLHQAPQMSLDVLAARSG
jgi:radical SAM protein with 4Fe4S-binding SPASM domain